MNPFAEKSADHEGDIRLIRGALNGSREDLERLVFLHQAWIYNIALKMVLDPRDAEDVTQEILIKLVTKLSLYDPQKGAFRTWLYRIVANHVINMKQRKWESLLVSFEANADAVEKIADASIDALPESSILVEELRIKCWTAMLLCLQRKQRLVFILGEILEVTDAVGSEILEISRANFRQLLSRARRKTENFMEQKCGLMNPENPCHCSRKLKGFIENGFIQPDRTYFFQENVRKIKDVVHEHRDDFERLFSSEMMRQFQDHPFYEPPDFEQWMGSLFQLDRLSSADAHS